MPRPLTISAHLPHGFIFSQSSLQDFADCERRFYLRYMEQQGWPAPLAEPQDAVEQALQRGARFHQLVERHRLGVPLDVVYATAATDPLLPTWLDNYQAALKQFGTFERTWAEVSLATRVDVYPVLAKFDFIGVQGSQVVAVDWKTGTLPALPILQQRLQTIIYRLVLYRQAAALTERDLSDYTLYYVSVADGQQRQFTVTADDVHGLATQVEQVITAVLPAATIP